MMQQMGMKETPQHTAAVPSASGLSWSPPHIALLGAAHRARRKLSCNLLFPKEEEFLQPKSNSVP